MTEADDLISLSSISKSDTSSSISTTSSCMIGSHSTLFKVLLPIWDQGGPQRQTIRCSSQLQLVAVLLFLELQRKNIVNCNHKVFGLLVGGCHTCAKSARKIFHHHFTKMSKPCCRDMVSGCGASAVGCLLLIDLQMWCQKQNKLDK